MDMNVFLEGSILNTFVVSSSIVLTSDPMANHRDVTPKAARPTTSLGCEGYGEIQKNRPNGSPTNPYVLHDLLAQV